MAIATSLYPTSDGRYTTEYRVIHPDGNIHWLSIEARAFFEGVGTVRNLVRTIGTCQDITDRKRMETQAQAATARLQILADASHAFAGASTDYQSVLSIVARQTSDKLGCASFVRLLTEDGQYLKLVIGHDANPEVSLFIQTLMADEPWRINETTPYMEVFRQGQSRLIPVVNPEQTRALTRPEYGQS